MNDASSVDKRCAERSWKCFQSWRKWLRGGKSKITIAGLLVMKLGISHTIKHDFSNHQAGLPAKFRDEVKWPPIMIVKKLSYYIRSSSHS